LSQINKLKQIKEKLIKMGHSAEDADLLVNNFYYLIKNLIKDLHRDKITKYD